MRDSKYDFTVESIGQANPLPGDSATVKQGEGKQHPGTGDTFHSDITVLTDTNLPKSRGQSSY